MLLIVVGMATGKPSQSRHRSGLGVGSALAFPFPTAVRGRVRPRDRPMRRCAPRGGAYHRHGSRRRRTVALTFDDGPSRLTPAFLAELERLHVRATFFVVGVNVPGRGGALRRMLRDGDAIGDHTLSHAVVRGGGAFAARQIRAGANVIRRATGYRPCVFRAPYGAVSRRLVSVARRQRVATIGWDVDPGDWELPGARAIASRVTAQVRPGSVVVLHDGGGARGQTLRALPLVVRTLRRRGYGFRTVPELLGYPCPPVSGAAGRRPSGGGAPRGRVHAPGPCRRHRRGPPVAPAAPQGLPAWTRSPFGVSGGLRSGDVEGDLAGVRAAREGLAARKPMAGGRRGRAQPDP